MLAFVTGASSGIGKEMAKVLAEKGYDLILTSKNKTKLLKARKEILKKIGNKNLSIKVISADLSNEEDIFDLYKKIQSERIDVFINNAGIGCAGEFWKIDLKKEINMLKVNNLAMHILFKKILKDMLAEKNKNEKYILNVASLSGFMPGPRMASYYATKSYTLNLTRSVYKELRMRNSKINLSVLCPGPIYTNFADRAGVIFKLPNLTSEYTAKYAINKMFEKKLVIIPGVLNKCGHLLTKVVPSKIIMAVIYRIQEPTRKKVRLLRK